MNEIYQTSLFGRKPARAPERDYHAENTAREARHNEIVSEILGQVFGRSQSSDLFYTRNGKQMPVYQENEAA